MPTAILTIDASPLAGIARRLQAVDVDRREPLEAIGAAWETTTRERFATGKAPDGTPWKPSLRVKEHGGKTLVLEGERGGLLGSITHRVDGDSVQVGTNKVYGRIHQFGGTIQRQGAHAVPLILPSEGAVGAQVRGVVQIPARPYLGANEADYENWTEILEGFLVDRTGGEVA